MRNKYTKEWLSAVAASCFSMAEVLRQLGLNPKAGGNYRYIWTKLRAYEISTSHFTGQGWSRGKEKPFLPRQRNEDVFVENCASNLCGPRIVRRLLALGWSYQCQACGLSDWRGRALTLHLDHINGINNDNRVENLRLLCPNCHQQTETWGNGKHRKASGRSESDQRL